MVATARTLTFEGSHAPRAPASPGGVGSASPPATRPTFIRSSVGLHQGCTLERAWFAGASLVDQTTGSDDERASRTQVDPRRSGRRASAVADRKLIIARREPERGANAT